MALTFLASHGIRNTKVSGVFAALGVLSMFWIPIATGIMAAKVRKFRNQDARHMHEQDTRASIENVVSTDEFQKAYRGLSRSVMIGRNDNVVKGIIRGRMYGDKSVNTASALSFGKIAVIVLAIMMIMYIIFLGVVIHLMEFNSSNAANQYTTELRIETRKAKRRNSGSYIQY